MNAQLLTVFKKEWRDAMRDKRSLTMLTVFVLLFPLMMWSSMNMGIKKATKADKEITEVIVIGAQQTPNLLRHLREGGLTIEERSTMEEDAITALLQERRYAAVLQVSEHFVAQYQQLRPAQITLWHDSAAGQDSKIKRIQKILRSYNNTIAQTRLLARGVSTAILSPIDLQEFDTATQASRAGKFIGAFLGVLFGYTFFYCFNTIIDTTAGERERRSLEILLAQPVAAHTLIMGKWLASASLCVIGLSCALIASHLALKSLPLEEIGMSWRVGYPELALLIFTAIPLCFFAPAMELGFALNSKSFKEAQSQMTLIAMIPLIPAIVVPMLDLTTQSWMFAIPVLAEQTLLLELSKGNTPAWHAFALPMLVSSLLAMASLGFASWRLKSERFVLGV